MLLEILDRYFVLARSLQRKRLVLEQDDPHS
jgi:hypothetical protein